MKIWWRIRQISFKQLVRLAFLFLKNPLLLIPTLKATKEALKVCDSLFGKSHHSNGKENAFRHALWNALICEKTREMTKNDEKSIIWTQKITDLYEKATKNNPLDKAMDLHNNHIGRMLFLNENKAEIVFFLQKRLENARKITNIEEIDLYNDRLIYISNSC